MPSHPDRVRRNYLFTCKSCGEVFDTNEKLLKHLATFFAKETEELKNEEIRRNPNTT